MLEPWDDTFFTSKMRFLIVHYIVHMKQFQSKNVNVSLLPCELCACNKTHDAFSNYEK